MATSTHPSTRRDGQAQEPLERTHVPEAHNPEQPAKPPYVAGPRTLCGSCGGGTHRHGSAASADFDCWWHQFSRAKTQSKTGKPLRPTPRLLKEFADWLDQGHAFKRPPRNDPGRTPEDPGDRVYF